MSIFSPQYYGRQYMSFYHRIKVHPSSNWRPGCGQSSYIYIYIIADYFLQNVQSKHKERTKHVPSKNVKVAFIHTFAPPANTRPPLIRP